ncbi:uncharacterized protein LOC110346618 isoform X5 [Heterocephalus glaber]|uniref:Uncharacterized protein LOC110346618 isoform X5 n=1 Tax=Heterocephalus glaber TaxID=10181 RepID=A0AAX6S4F8_HETGA|nr:uncharacterized protein LOC110346618 isoform X5 [Heterocephalus glaber]
MTLITPPSFTNIVFKAGAAAALLSRTENPMTPGSRRLLPPPKQASLRRPKAHPGLTWAGPPCAQRSRDAVLCGGQAPEPPLGRASPGVQVPAQGQLAQGGWRVGLCLSSELLRRCWERGPEARFS